MKNEMDTFFDGYMRMISEMKECARRILIDLFENEPWELDIREEFALSNTRIRMMTKSYTDTLEGRKLYPYEISNSIRELKKSSYDKDMVRVLGVSEFESVGREINKILSSISIDNPKLDFEGYIYGELQKLECQLAKGEYDKIQEYTPDFVGALDTLASKRIEEKKDIQILSSKTDEDIQKTLLEAKKRYDYCLKLILEENIDTRAATIQRFEKYGAKDVEFSVDNKGVSAVVPEIEGEVVSVEA